MLKYGYSTKKDGDMKDPENVKKLLDSFGFKEIVQPRLQHGSIISSVAEKIPKEIITGDGLITKVKGIALAVKFTDCYPVMFYSKEPDETICIVHAGWRGIKAGIIEDAVKKMNLLGCIKFDVLIGPGICTDDYEVKAFVALDFNEVTMKGHKTFLDLRTEIIKRLFKMGVQEPWIKNLASCTKHDDTFFSHRGGDKERNIALIGIL